jgi:hypothetical protein
MNVWCVCAFFCVCVFLCLGRGLATSWSLAQGVLPSVNDQETEKSALCSKVGATSQMGAKRKKKIMHDGMILNWSRVCFEHKLMVWPGFRWLRIGSSGRLLKQKMNLHVLCKAWHFFIREATSSCRSQCRVV